MGIYDLCILTMFHNLILLFLNLLLEMNYDDDFDHCVLPFSNDFADDNGRESMNQCYNYKLLCDSCRVMFHLISLEFNVYP